MQTQLKPLQAGIEQNNGRVEGLTTLVHERTNVAHSNSEDNLQSVNSVEVTTELCFDTRLVKDEGAPTRVDPLVQDSAG